jgi:hypothetical protein
LRKSQIALAALAACDAMPLAAQAAPPISGNEYQATDLRSFAQQNQ